MQRVLRALVIALAVAAPFTPRPSTATGVPPRAECLHGIGPFLRADGARLSFAGGPVQLYGATMYPFVRAGGRVIHGRAWTRRSFPLYVRSMLDLAAAAHLTTIRVTDYLAGARQWDDPVVWSNIDTVLCQAQQRHMFVIISLSAYRNWLEQRHHFGYDPHAWVNFLRFVGQRYAGAPALAYYALAGEPAPPHSHRPLRPTARQLIDFYRAAALELVAADGGHHLIATGGLSDLNWDSGIPWQTLFTLPHIAIAAIHVYSQGDRDTTLPMVGQWAAAHAKPFMVEEFGFRQELGDGPRASAFADLNARAAQVHASGIVFWNLGPELAPHSFDVNPQTPLVWQQVQRSAPTSLTAGQATPAVTANGGAAATPSPPSTARIDDHATT